MRLTTKELAYAGLFAALITIGAFIKIDIPLPLYTMHFTLQWMFVLMAGFLLGARLGAVSVITYITIGLLGVPVFAAGGGLSYVLRPGFGFLLGFIVAAYIIGYIVEMLHIGRWAGLIAASTVGLMAYYTIGALYFYLIKNLYVGEAISFSVIVVQYCFITVLPDFILCIMAASLSVKLMPAFKSMSVLRA